MQVGFYLTDLLHIVGNSCHAPGGSCAVIAENHLGTHVQQCPHICVSSKFRDVLLGRHAVCRMRYAAVQIIVKCKKVNKMK